MSEIIPCHQRLWLLYAIDGHWFSSQIIAFTPDAGQHYQPVVLLETGMATMVQTDNLDRVKVVREVKLAGETAKFVTELERSV